jgi:transposase InsO family protein
MIRHLPLSIHPKVTRPAYRARRLGDQLRQYVETFNGSLRDECLNVYWFETMDQAREIIEAWRRGYNEIRPHMALAEVAPSDLARQIGRLPDQPSVVNAGN